MMSKLRQLIMNFGAATNRNAPKFNSLLAGICTVFLITSMGMAKATTVNVDAQSNIFKASITGGGDGLDPVLTSFTAGAGQILTFSSVAGLTNCCSSSALTLPDGENGSTNVNSSGGISGVVAPRTLFLAGVFVNTGNAPGGTAPDRLNYNGALQVSDLSFSPLLNQTFFIGDGLTGNGIGDIQSFIVPTLADAFYLGFVDGGSFVGNPSFYNDNTGSLDAVFDIGAPTSVVPVPAALPLFGTGLAIMGFIGWRRKRKATI